jgi:hypothetical protein
LRVAQAILRRCDGGERFIRVDILIVPTEVVRCMSQEVLSCVWLFARARALFRAKYRMHMAHPVHICTSPIRAVQQRSEGHHHFYDLTPLPPGSPLVQ